MKFQGVIFDLDGTLANTLKDIANSMNRVLSNNSFPTHDLESYRYFVGKGIKNLVRESLPQECRSEDMVKKCFEGMMVDYRQHCLIKTKLYDGIAELMQLLVERNIKLAVFSNKADELTKLVVKELLPFTPFEVVMGATPDIPRKPDPRGAMLISKALGIKPQNLLYIGDTGIDMNTATSAGIYAVGALWGFRSKEELFANGAKIVIEHPLDLMKILD